MARTVVTTRITEVTTAAVTTTRRPSRTGHRNTMATAQVATAKATVDGRHRSTAMTFNQM